MVSLEQEVKVRYLLQHVFERVREDGKVYNRLVKVLSRLGGRVRDECDAMNREVAKESTTCGENRNDEIALKDVPHLVQCLVSCSHLWEVIGIALEIPKHKLVDCGEGKASVSRLNNILTAYVQADYEGARPATLRRLKEALASDIVNQRVLAHKLQMPTHQSRDTLPVGASSQLEISDQSYDTEVTEGKSTLLEVQVSSSGYESYQWSKYGQPVLDGADFSGVCSNILYINKASKCTEGKYSCRVSRGSETECSDEISLSVVYPPEKRELVKLYSDKERKLAQDSWPPTAHSDIINLVLVRHQKKGSYDYYTVRGDMDDILESKEVADYEEVFKEYREGGFLLVEGRPGCGKTTLVHKLTRDWAEGKKVLQGARMVFLVTLRLVNESGRDKSLLDLLQIHYGQTSLSRSIEQGLKESRGKGACFILDGLDEYPIEKKKNSVIDELLNTKTLLPDSMVIVASRPVATDKLKERCKARLEVIGFHKDQIYSYVRSYPFLNSGMTIKMEEYLEQHPNVLHMCYLPVHAAMICFLFSKLKGDIPQTETQIYEKFTIATILRHEANKSEGLSKIKSLMELRGEEKTLFSSVCKLAFDMMTFSQQVIRKSDIQASFLSDFNLGLLTVERTSEHYGSEDLYTFHHLTFQEFLAAFYISKVQVTNKKLVDDWIWINVLKFYCGLSPSSATAKLVYGSSNRIGSHLKIQCAFESQHVEFCNYVVRDGNIDVPDGIISSTDSIALAYVISKCTKPVTKMMILDNCTWNSDGVKLFASLVSSDKLQSIRCLRARVYEDNMFEVLNTLLHYLPFLEELNLNEIKLNKSLIECLTSGINLAHLEVLTISLPLVPCSNPGGVFQLLTFGSYNIQRVFYSVHKGHPVNHAVWRKMLSYAFGCQIVQESDLSWLHLYNSETAPSLPHERLSHCTEVVLVNCCIGDEGAEILASTLNPSVLENLVLDFNQIGDSGAIVLAGYLARCSAIQEVSIECNSIGDSGATALADALVHCNSLRKLNLQGNGLGDKGAVAIAKATENLPSLDLYLHSVNITEEGIERVLEHRARTSIKNMVFTPSWDIVSEADIDTLRRAVYCGNLPALKLSRKNIYNIEKLVAEQEQVKNVRGIVCDEYCDDYYCNDDCCCCNYDTVPTQCRIIEHLPYLHHVDIRYKHSYFIISSSAHRISDSLKGCKYLHSLVLHGRGHMSIILDAVKCSTKLHSLDLVGCHIDQEEVDILCSNVEFWVNLHNLYLPVCPNGNYNALYKVLGHCKKLRRLNLAQNEVDNCAALAEGLKDHTSLIELKLRLYSLMYVPSHFMKNHHLCMPALSYVIRCNDQLQCLDLRNYSSLTPGDVSTLVASLFRDSLHTLDLYRTGLGDDGIASLSVGLKKFTQLVKLNIGGNNISSRCIECLSVGLQYCSKLQVLNLHFNPIESYGVKCLSEGLQYCSNLQVLNLTRTGITHDGVSAILDIMKSCKNLQELDLADNSIGMNSAAVLVGGWQHKSLLTLNLSYCFGDSHESALHDGSKCCESCDCLLQLYSNNDYVHINNIGIKQILKSVSLAIIG